MRVALRSVQPLCAAPQRAWTPPALLEAIDADHRCHGLLRFLANRHPGTVTRRELILAGGFNYQGPIGAPAALEFWLLQLNLDLPGLGWTIAEAGQLDAKKYWLKRL